jgi:hypothetical protein
VSSKLFPVSGNNFDLAARVESVNLYVCWTTHDAPLPGYRHHCSTAYEALREAGHDPEVKHALSFGGLPGAIQTPARKKVKEHTGRYWVPALETDDGKWIGGTQEIVAWAAANPAATGATA